MEKRWDFLNSHLFVFHFFTCFVYYGHIQMTFGREKKTAIFGKPEDSLLLNYCYILGSRDTTPIADPIFR